MKNSLNQLRFAFAILLAAILFSTNINAQNQFQIDGCCVTFTYGLNETGGTWQFHPNCDLFQNDPQNCPEPNLLQEGNATGSQVTILHCYPENGVYQASFNQTSPDGGINGSSHFINITDCEDTQDCATNEVNCPLPNGSDLGDYTVCCDGSLTVNSTATATYVKVWNISSTLCIDLGGQVNGTACILCGLWNNNAPCGGGNWTFPAGTVTQTNNAYIEFQSSSPWHEFDCDWSGGTGWLPLSSVLVELGCEPGFAGNGSGKKSDTNATGIAADISLSPNPANSFVNINNPDAKNLSIEIYNSSGQLLVAQNSAESSTTIDTHNFAQGLYLVQIRNNDTQEFISTEKLILVK